MRNFITKAGIIRFAGILLLLLLWKLLSWKVVSEDIVPSPETTFIALLKIVGHENFWPSIAFTVLRGIEGFIIALFLSLLLGIPAGLNISFFNFINPLLAAIRSTPIISIILLAIIWFGSEQVPVFIAVLTMFPVICTNVIEGIRNVDKELISMGEIYKVKPRRILTEIYMPAITPYLTGGISNALGFGWRAIIIGEVLAQPRFGIGTMMQRSQIYLLVSELIAWTVIAIFISYLFELIVRIVEKKIVRWKQA